MRPHILTAPLAAVLVLAGRAGAQPPTAGDRVCAYGPGTAGRWCEARVVRAAGDTLLLTPMDRCPSGAFAPAAPAHLEVARGDRGSRAAHALLGFVGGAAVGAVLPAGPRWVRTGAPQPVRVAGLALRPGVRVALGRRRT